MAGRGKNGHLARPQVAAALRMVTALFPSGTPIAAAQVLSGAVSLFHADGAALVLTRVDPKRHALVAIDSLLFGFDPQREQFFDSILNNPRWETDAVARCLKRRATRAPAQPSTCSLIKLNRLASAHAGPTYTTQFLQTLGWTSDCCSLLPLGEGVVSILMVSRNATPARPFGRSDARLLTSLHEVLATRVVELRATRLRNALPKSVRETFSLVLAGHTEKEIARLTHRSPNTVHDHIKRIYQHFAVSSRAQLLAQFVDIDRVAKHDRENEPRPPVTTRDAVIPKR